MTAEQLSRAAELLTEADDPQYMVAMIRGHLNPSRSQAICLRELAKVEKQRRAAS